MLSKIHALHYLAFYSRFAPSLLGPNYKSWHLSSFRIDQAMAICGLKFKWAEWPQFLSPTLQIFKSYKTFEDVEMMLLEFLDISLSFKFPNFPCHPAVQSSRGPGPMK